MAYDEVLASRIREALIGVQGISERKMFGGVGFMVNGHMAVGAGSAGKLMVRVDPEDLPVLITRPGVEAMEMRGRKLSGWLLVSTEALDAEEALREWVERGVSFVRRLPPK